VPALCIQPFSERHNNRASPLHECPPAENSSTPILCRSMCHSAAWKRTSPTVLCASYNAIGDFGYTLAFGSNPTLGTRYFNNTHVIPFTVSPSQTSVPSRSIASMEYPPPGKTTTAATVLGNKRSSSASSRVADCWVARGKLFVR